MPIYEYACPNGHRIERLRKYIMRDRKPAGSPCLVCGKRLKRVPSLPHCPPDGIYSYAPNVGSAEAFERRQQAIKAKAETGVQQVIPKQT